MVWRGIRQGRRKEGDTGKTFRIRLLLHPYPLDWAFFFILSWLPIYMFYFSLHFTFWTGKGLAPHIGFVWTPFLHLLHFLFSNQSLQLCPMDRIMPAGRFVTFPSMNFIFVSGSALPALWPWDSLTEPHFPKQNTGVVLYVAVGSHCTARHSYIATSNAPIQLKNCTMRMTVCW